MHVCVGGWVDGWVDGWIWSGGGGGWTVRHAYTLLHTCMQVYVCTCVCVRVCVVHPSHVCSSPRWVPTTPSTCR